MDKTASTWREHATCDWTWPSAHGVTGCVEHGVVFESPTPDETWGIMPAMSLGEGLLWTP